MRISDWSSDVCSSDLIMPIEAVNADQVFRIVELAQRGFDTVYLDLPGNWTNWSMSLVARSQVVFLVCELTIASLRQARRQISLLRDQAIDPARIHFTANRVAIGRAAWSERGWQ